MLAFIWGSNWFTQTRSTKTLLCLRQLKSVTKAVRKPTDLATSKRVERGGPNSVEGRNVSAPKRGWIEIYGDL